MTSRTRAWIPNGAPGNYHPEALGKVQVLARAGRDGALAASEGRSVHGDGPQGEIFGRLCTSISCRRISVPVPSVSHALFFGFGTAMLGIRGFESSANCIEEQKTGVFPKTLRNMWLAVAVFNPLISLLSLGLLPLVQIQQVPPDLLAQMGSVSVGPFLARWVSVDAVLVLSGAVLTSFVGNDRPRAPHDAGPLPPPILAAGQYDPGHQSLDPDRVLSGVRERAVHHPGRHRHARRRVHAAIPIGDEPVRHRQHATQGEAKPLAARDPSELARRARCVRRRRRRYLRQCAWLAGNDPLLARRFYPTAVAAQVDQITDVETGGTAP